ncbi:PIN domain-containing protein [Arachnia propionica]|uniref:Ribonuclease VapC n=1 Tax=Arachnia propionica TaxID=1750 RepID=A0A3P1WNV6_9ACTN|nr:PIN domain-containing protein [Arachnia propionica]RRD48309.1 PIN domain-containing protein [Arachnia propionica]
MSIWLLDADVLIASVFPDHEHHREVVRWWREFGEGSFATNGLVEGALVRFALRSGLTVAAAQRSLQSVHARPGWQFFADAPSYVDVDLSSVVGHKQVTDHYLAAVARMRRATVLTLDRAFADSCPDVLHLTDWDANRS